MANQPVQTKDMMPITDRQIRILKAIVQEYCETAQPVGSDTLDKKYQIGFSPATIRNEMCRLTQTGYLVQPHTSSGRIPSPMAIKFYVHQLMQEKQLPVTEEVKVKQQMWDAKGEVGKLMREVTHVLAAQTHMLAVAATDQGKTYCSGYANILDMQEFFDIDVTKSVLTIIDHVDMLMEMFNHVNEGEQPYIVIGDDFGNHALLPIGMVYTKFSLGGTSGAVGVLGPSRLDYSYVMPTVRYVGNLLDQIGSQW